MIQNRAATAPMPRAITRSHGFNLSSPSAVGTIKNNDNFDTNGEQFNLDINIKCIESSLLKLVTTSNSSYNLHGSTTSDFFHDNIFDTTNTASSFLSNEMKCVGSNSLTKQLHVNTRDEFPLTPYNLTNNWNTGTKRSMQSDREYKQFNATTASPLAKMNTSTPSKFYSSSNLRTHCSTSSNDMRMVFKEMVNKQQQQQPHVSQHNNPLKTPQKKYQTDRRGFVSTNDYEQMMSPENCQPIYNLKNSNMGLLSPPMTTSTSSLSASVQASPLAASDLSWDNNQQDNLNGSPSYPSPPYYDINSQQQAAMMHHNNANYTPRCQQNRAYYFNPRKSIKMSVPSNKRQILEEEFRKEKYPSSDKIQKLSAKLTMRYEEVQNYFKKRRKEEKETNHKFSNLVKLLNNYLEQED
jgi:hypothetical protein